MSFEPDINNKNFSYRNNNMKSIIKKIFGPSCHDSNSNGFTLHENFKNNHCGNDNLVESEYFAAIL